ncbi:MAG TPA: imidazole glycerol phosphate synthase subunit HisH [Clostridiales bacterium UBA8960]|jgi:glutamine amidotransferase|nr:imidazole glycerol phosphate synthase subunit HisH [Clostridiales bacterium UBA8960]
MIAIVDYGSGNIRSLINALKSEEVILTADPGVLSAAKFIVLPGVGAFGYAMAQLEEKNLIHVLKALNAEKKKMVGICLGMQLFYERSDEHGIHEGLGFLKGKIKVLPDTVKKPHIGWNKLIVGKEDSLLTKGLKTDDFAYFVHSYYADDISTDSVVASTGYGISVPAIVHQDNLVGYQFHPEKSGQVGKLLLDNLKECFG